MRALGIDVGGTFVKSGIVDDTGAILAQRSDPTPASLDQLHALLGGLARELPGDVGGIGVGCKGIIEARSTRVAVLPGTLNYLEGQTLSELLDTPLPVYADNDARTAMVGEMLWGAACGVENALLFTLGTGVGGAVLADGRLLRGAAGVAGHVGHLTVEADGAPCICGNRGCLETVFSAKAIEAAAFRAIHAGVESVLTRRYAACPGTITCEAVFAAAAEGDTVAAGIRDNATMRLGAAIAGLVLVFDPERVILGGSIMQAGPALLDPVTREIWERTRGLLRRNVQVVRASREEAGVAGAAGLVMLPTRCLFTRTEGARAPFAG